jgi:predicted permease
VVFLNVLLPVFLIALTGYAFGRFTHFDVTPLTKVAFYLLAPALIFHGLYTSTTSGGEIGTIVLFVALLHFGLFGLGWLGTRALGWETDSRVATILSLSNNNTASYGLSVLLFAFGEQGFALGVVYMLALLVFQMIFGVGIAAWKEGSSINRLFLNVLKVPWFHALALAFLFRGIGVQLPQPLLAPIELVSRAAIPVFLLVLGIQLAQIKFGGVFFRAGLIASAKLILPPLLAFGLVTVLGVEGLLRTVLIIEASTPTAVNTLILALQYHRDPDLVASVVLLTTLGSVLTMGLLLAFLV